MIYIHFRYELREVILALAINEISNISCLITHVEGCSHVHWLLTYCQTYPASTSQVQTFMCIKHCRICSVDRLSATKRSYTLCI